MTTPNADLPPQDHHGAFFQWHRWDEVIASIALCVIVFCISWGVISRYVLPVPASWTYEVAIIVFAYLVFFGAISGIRLGSHAAIDVLVDALPLPWRKSVAWMNYILLAGLFLIMALMFFRQAYVSAGVRGVALDLSRAWYYAPLGIACSAMLIQHLMSDRPWRAETLQRHADSII